MNIEFVGRGYRLDDGVRQFAQEKLDKVSKFLEEPVEVRITLEVEKHRQIADVHIAHRLGIVQAKEEAGDMYDALNTAVDKAEKQARRSRKKLTGRKRRNDSIHHQWPLEVVERSSLGGGGEKKIVRSTQLQIKPMSIDEAALHLESSKNDFVVFRDATTDKVHVLYKRKDDHYGLIAPEI